MSVTINANGVNLYNTSTSGQYSAAYYNRDLQPGIGAACSALHNPSHAQFSQTGGLTPQQLGSLIQSFGGVVGSAGDVLTALGGLVSAYGGNGSFGCGNNIASSIGNQLTNIFNQLGGNPFGGAQAPSNGAAPLALGNRPSFGAPTGAPTGAPSFGPTTPTPLAAPTATPFGQPAPTSLGPTLPQPSFSTPPGQPGGPVSPRQPAFGNPGPIGPIAPPSTGGPSPLNGHPTTPNLGAAGPTSATGATNSHQPKIEMDQDRAIRELAKNFSSINGGGFVTKDDLKAIANGTKMPNASPEFKAACDYISKNPALFDKIETAQATNTKTKKDDKHALDGKIGAGDITAALTMVPPSADQKQAVDTLVSHLHDKHVHIGDSYSVSDLEAFAAGKMPHGKKGTPPADLVKAAQTVLSDPAFMMELDEGKAISEGKTGKADGKISANDLKSIQNNYNHHI